MTSEGSTPSKKCLVRTLEMLGSVQFSVMPRTQTLIDLTAGLLPRIVTSWRHECCAWSAAAQNRKRKVDIVQSRSILYFPHCDRPAAARWTGSAIPNFDFVIRYRCIIFSKTGLNKSWANIGGREGQNSWEKIMKTTGCEGDWMLDSAWMLTYSWVLGSAWLCLLFLNLESF